MKESSKNQDFIDFSKEFLTNKDCLEYFKKIRWKRGFGIGIGFVIIHFLKPPKFIF